MPIFYRYSAFILIFIHLSLSAVLYSSNRLYSKQKFYRQQVYRENMRKIYENNNLNQHINRPNRWINYTQSEWSDIYLANHHAQKTRVYHINQNLNQDQLNNTQNSSAKAIASDLSLFKNDQLNMSLAKLQQINFIRQGIVSKIKDQGLCGCCYAFSMIGAFQSFLLIRKKNYTLSQQQLLECTDTQFLKGCQGGSFIYAYQYVLDHGIALEKDYPYTGIKNECKQLKNITKIQMTRAYVINEYINTQLAYGGCTSIYEYLKIQPISVGVLASADWMFYGEGIYNNCSGAYQNNFDLNHGVVLVGFSPARQNTPSYWTIKNSWGIKWGQSGFMRISTQKYFNACNICFFAAIPIN